MNLKKKKMMIQASDWD